jgi:GNAT superfamily N-acetyltransferase
MNIRIIEPDDVSQVIAIIHRALREVNAKDDAPAIILARIEKYTPEFLSSLMKSRDIFVAEHDNTILGTISLDQDTIYTFYVDPMAQGKGVGSALSSYVETLMITRGQTYVLVPSSISAHNFYLNRGYFDTEHVYEDNYLAKIMMRKKIKIAGNY